VPPLLKPQQEHLKLVDLGRGGSGARAQPGAPCQRLPGGRADRSEACKACAASEEKRQLFEDEAETARPSVGVTHWSPDTTGPCCPQSCALPLHCRKVVPERRPAAQQPKAGRPVKWSLASPSRQALRVQRGMAAREAGRVVASAAMAPTSTAND
jgi:hypothetical protein